MDDDEGAPAGPAMAHPAPGHPATAHPVLPERERLPDPTALPLLPPSPLERPPRVELPLGDHLPDDWLYHPSESFALWREAWERDLRFRFTSHRGLAGRAIVALKRLFAPLLRAPLSDHLQRERIFNVVLLRHLERQMEEVRHYLLEVRNPYSFVRDWAVPDLIARMDALFSILDQRLDAVAASGGAGGGEPDPEVYASCLAACRRLVDLASGDGRVLAAVVAAGGVGYGLETDPAQAAAARGRGLEVREEEAVSHLGGLADGSLDGVCASGGQAWDSGRLLRAAHLARAKLAAGGSLLLESGGGGAGEPPLRPDALALALRAVGFEAVAVLGRTVLARR